VLLKCKFVLIHQPKKERVILDEWYRQRMKEIVPTFINTWERTLNVNVRDFGIKKMKTKWVAVIAKRVESGSIWNLLRSPGPVSNTLWYMKWFIYWKGNTVKNLLSTWITSSQCGNLLKKN
jgi:hypothetical protein